MSKDENERLAPGEIALEPLPSGHVAYAVRGEAGDVECGIARAADGASGPADVGLIEMGSEVRPGVRRMKSFIRYNARGPAAVASNAYRSGWESTFGKRSAPS